ncbi:MAG: helix-turn-helix domain-containing protein [Microbacteriaceae bacterium]
MKNPEPALLDVSAAADYLAVKVSYVRRMVRERRIPFVKIGALVRFERAELDSLIESGRRDAR